MKDYILVKDNLLSVNECEDLINKFSVNIKKGEDWQEYNYYDLEGDYFKSIYNKLDTVFDEYINLYPEVDLTTSPKILTNLRFKHFLPGKSFANWHSEHSFDYSNRVLSIQIYLSDHDCGTVFYNGKKIMSKSGRVAVFPAYFTHTHKGEVCPENKDRYLLTGYISFISKGKTE